MPAIQGDQTDNDVALEATIDELNQQAADLRQNDAQLALRLCQQAHALASGAPNGYPRGLFASLANIAVTELFLGHYEDALNRALEAQAQVGQLGDPALEAQLHEIFAMIYDVLGDYPRALDALLRFQAFCEQSGDIAGQALGSFRVGMLNSGLGNYLQALGWYDRALALYQQSDNAAGQARVLNSYCVDQTHLGNYEQAISCGWRSFAIFEAIGNRFGAGVALSSLGEAYTAAGEYDTALGQFQRALGLLQERNQNLESHEAQETLLAIGRLYNRKAEPDRALEYLLPVLATVQSAQNHQSAYDCCRAIAEAYEAKGQFAEALAYYKQYAALKETVLNEISLQKYQHLEVLHRTQQAIAEAERERRLREDEQRHFEAVSQMKNEFVRIASHDLKNPLGIITGGAQLLDMIANLDDESQEIVHRIEHAARRMRDLIGDMLDILKLETGHALRLRPFVLRQLLEEVLADFALQAQMKQQMLLNDLAAGELVVRGDQAQLRRALENLLSNALKYTPVGGQISVGLAANPAEAQISVHDTGIGIPAQDLPHIFDHFYRVRSVEHQAIEGTGLGLAIVKSIVEQHRGTIAAVSQPGAGSTFTLTLPLSPSPAARAS